MANSINVKLIDDKVVQSQYLSVDTSYISFNWDDDKENAKTVSVSKNYIVTDFSHEDKTKFCDPNGSVTFSGETSTDTNYSIKVTEGDEYFGTGNTKEDNSFRVYPKKQNSGDTDITGIVTVYSTDLDGKTIQAKTIELIQFADTSFVTYTITSNAEDGAKVTFKDTSACTVVLKDGIAEYSRRKVGAVPLDVTISGGLLTSASTWVFVNTDGVTSSTISNEGETNFIPPSLSAIQTTVQYTYSLEDITASTTVECEPGERKYVEVFKKTDAKYVDWEREPTEYSWISANTTNNKGVNIGRNENINIERSAILTYHIVDNPSVTFRYKVTQTKGNYVFDFDGEPISSMTNGNVTYNVKIKSYLNSPNNFIPFQPKYDLSEANVTTNSSGATIVLKRNYLLSTRYVRITFIQDKSKKRITTKWNWLKQYPSDCKIGDVYAYSPNKGYASFRFSSGETIADGFTPIGVVVMPFDNNCPSSSEYARVISLTESIRKDTTPKNFEKLSEHMKYTWYKRRQNEGGYEELYKNKFGYEHLSSLSVKYSIDDYNDYYPMNEYRALGSVIQDAYTDIDNTYQLFYSKDIRKNRGNTSYDGRRKMPAFTEDNSDTNFANYSGKFKLSSESNYACTDFKGKDNFITENEAVKKYNSDDRQDNIDNYDNSFYYYISNYSTLDKNKGHWYLGSLGEMSYVSVYSNIINSTLKALQPNFSITLVATQDNLGGVVGWIKHGNHNSNYDTSDYGYWTSTMSSGKSIPTKWGFYSSAIVVVGPCMIGWQEHQRRDDNKHWVQKRVRPMLMIDKNGNPK